MKPARALLCLALLAAAGQAHADATGAEFLLQDMDAHVMAQGGAAVARPHDLNGLRANPAGLAGIPGPRAAFTHLSAFGEWDHDWLAGALPWGRNSLGLEILSSRLKSFTYYDDSSQAAGNINAGSLQGALGFAHAFSTSALGLNFRLFRGQVAEYSNWGMAADLGGQWQPAQWLSLGASVQHLGAQTAYYAKSDPLPALGRVGAQTQGQLHEDLGVGFAVEFLQSVDPGRGAELHLGGQLELFKKASLRFGGQMQDRAWSPTLGLGFKLGGLELSYAFRPIETLGSDHVITLNLQDLGSLFPDEPAAKK